MADLGRILNPCLNIVEGMVGQTGQEWGGEGRVTDVLIAGDQTTATDACGAYLMGHDPASDWPTPPFKRERNYILLAASKGFGTVDLNQINFNSEVKPFTGYFDSNNTDPAELLKSWRKTASEQGLYYLEHRKELVEKYAGEYIFLQKGKVVWHGLDTSSLKSRRILSGEDKGEALWMKYVDPDDMEEENFEVYRRELEEMAKME